jgi:ABC-type dipeptide/oligopeptide/nickel transport system permease subunit
MRLADIIIMLPAISLLIVLTALFGLNLFQLALVLGILAGFGGTAIVLKSQALSIKVKPYIEAAKVAGGSQSHIIFVHIVPNLLPLSLLYMMFTVTAAIFSEAVLSFFGILNVRMSWGIMIHTASSGGYLLGGTRFWWLIIPAGASITLLCSAFYLVGRALDEVVNPRLRRQYDQ